MKSLYVVFLLVLCTTLSYTQPLGKHSIMLDASTHSVYGMLSYRYQLSTVISVHTGIGLGEVPVAYESYWGSAPLIFASETLVASPLFIGIAVPFQQSMLDIQVGALLSWKPVQFYHSDYGTDAIVTPIFAAKLSYCYVFDDLPWFVTANASIYAPYGNGSNGGTPPKIVYTRLAYSIGVGYTFK